jgi:uncharacterized membrane protein
MSWAFSLFLMMITVNLFMVCRLQGSVIYRFDRSRRVDSKELKMKRSEDKHAASEGGK